MISNKSSHAKVCAVFLLLIASVLFAYWNVNKCDFVSFDDLQYVCKNYNVNSGINKNNLIWSFTSFYAANWHPLTWISHAVDCQIYGLDPAGHHRTSLLFHILNTLLLFLALKVMTGTVWRSAFVAALFGLHPLHVESVAWVAERKDVLSTFFMFLALLCYATYAKRKKQTYYFGALFLFALGLMAKPMIVTMPFVLLLLDFWPLGRIKVFGSQNCSADTLSSVEGPKKLIAEKIPFLILSAASCVITVLAQHAGNAIINVEQISMVRRLANAVEAYGMYMGKMFWPAHLSFFYPFPITLPSVWTLSLFCLLLLLITGIVLFLRNRRPYLLTGWFWYLGMLVPVIGIVQVSSQSLADRYTYVPLIGLFIVSSWFLYDVASFGRHCKVGAITVSLAVLLLLSLQTHRQVEYWKNDLSLADHSISVTKNNYLAYSVKGGYLLTKNRLEEAHRNLYLSLLIDSNLVSSKLNIGWIYLREGKPQKAIALFNEIVQVDSNNINAHFNSGIAYGMLNDMKSAVRCFSRAIAADSSYAPALYNLGLAYGALKEYDLCTNLLLKAVRYVPKSAEYYFSLGNCCFGNNKLEDAIRWYEKSVELDPGFPDVHRQLGDAYKMHGKPELATKHFKIADSLALHAVQKGK